MRSSKMFHAILNFSKHKMVRGMLSYALLWPGSCLIEQVFVEGRTLKNFDWKQCLRYSVFGSIVIAPTMFVWVRVAAAMWPRRDFKSSLLKGLTEQVALDPFGIALFLYSMSIMEGKTPKEAENEVRIKFFDIFKVGILYWPTVQTLNFMYVPVHNQVVVMSFYSLIWTTFLACIKSTNAPDNDETCAVDFES